MKIALHRFSEPADALLQRLEQAATRDKKAERNFKIGCAVLVIGGIGGFFGLAALAERLGNKWPFLGLLLLLGVIVFLVGEHGHDVDDRKLAATTELVRKLRADVPVAENVQLMVDFREYRKGGTKVQQPKETKVQGAGDKYQQKWLEVRTTLADGTQVNAAITDRVTRKERRKRKYVKVKETFASDVSLLLRLDKRYGDAERVIPRLGGDPSPDGTMVRSRRGRGRRLFVATRTRQVRRVSGRGGVTGDLGSLASGGAVLELLRWVYRGIASTSSSPAKAG